MALTADDTILNGKYHIIRLIGQGGMARVWLAEELTFGNRQVALKEPRDDLLPHLRAEVAERYQREVEVCAALEQAQVPNTVRAITAEPYGESLLLVMEYMPGGDLADLLREHPQGLPIDRAVDIARCVLVALDGAHQDAMEIVHRDVKPSNILFDGEGVAHLADFGLSQLPGLSGRSRLTGAAHPGTPLYMAPEQGTAVTYVTPAADLYALGCVLFEMLTGRRYKRHRPGTSVRRVREQVPEWLEVALAKALEEDPFDRWQEAGDMAQVLERGLATQQRARQEAEERARREERRRQQLAGWYAEAERLLPNDAQGALELVTRIRSQAPGYEGLAALERRAQELLEAEERARREEKRRQQLAGWYAEAERLLPNDPKRALDLVKRIRSQAPGYEGLTALQHRAQEVLEAKERAIWEEKRPQQRPARRQGSARVELLRVLKGDMGHIEAVAFSPGGETLAAGGLAAVLTQMHGGCIFLWGVDDGMLLNAVSDVGDSYVWTLAFSPTGRLLASGSSDRRIRIWWTDGLSLITTLRGHRDLITSVAFSPDCETLASASQDTTVRLWKVPEGRRLRVLKGHKKSATSVAFSPDGETLAVSSYKIVHLCRVADGVVRFALEGHFDWVGSVAFSPDGKLLASGSNDATVRIWRVSDGQLLNTLQTGYGAVSSVAFSPDGGLLASAPGDRVHLFWVADGEPMCVLEDHESTVNSVAFSPDGRLLASGSTDGTVRLWRVRNR